MATLVNVGSFAKTTGAATAAQQVAHGLAGTPTAIIFFWSGQTSQDSFGAAVIGGLGLFANGGNSFSYAVGMLDAAATATTSSRYAAKAITMVAGGETLLAECDLTVDGTNMDFSWTTNDGNAYIINFIALGGDIDNAEVINWQAPATATEIAVTGFGFEPDCLITCMATNTTNPAHSYAFADFNVGVAVKGGGQWSVAYRDQDNVATMTNHRAHLATAIGTSAGDTSGYGDANIQSWDSDGFTLNFINTTNGAECFTLGLKGGVYFAGSFRKTNNAATATQKIAGGPTDAKGVILASAFLASTFAYGAQARMGFGASDGTDERAVVHLSEDAQTDSDVDNYTASAKALVIADNNTPAVDSECDVTISGGDVTLSWTTNAAVFTLISFLIFADETTVQAAAPGLIPNYQLGV